MNSGDGHEVPKEKLPAELRGALRRQYGGKQEIPGNIDTQILSDATSVLAARTVLTRHRVRRGHGHGGGLQRLQIRQATERGE